MQLKITLITLLLDSFNSVEGWSCVSTVTEVFSRVNLDAVLRFDISADVNPQTTNTYDVRFHDNSLQALVSYANGVITTDKISGVEISADLQGNVVFTKQNVGTGDAGIYYISSSSAPTRCSCLYILGSPTKASISATSSPSVGGSATLSCSSTSTTTPSNHSLGFRYSWRVDSTDNPSGPRYSYSANTMTLSDVVKDDVNKQFTCVATEDVSNGFTSSRSDALTLDFHYGPENVAFSPTETSYEREENTNLGTITCSAGCNPPCTFKWNKVGQSAAVGNNGVLNLGALSSSDAGTYRCTAMRAGGTDDAQDLTVNVIYGPSNINFSPADTSYTYNENVNPPAITCGSSCWLCEYSWTGPNSYSLSGPVLDLDSLSRTMHGQYTCTATNTKVSPQRQEQKHVTIEVRYGPDTPNISVQSPHTVREGDVSEDIRCSSDCYPGCSYDWTNVTGRTSVSSNGVLSLGRVDRYMAGSYKCTVRNTAIEYTKTSEETLSVIVRYVAVQSFYLEGHLGQQNVTVDEHHQIRFKCIVDSNSVATVKILFDSNLLEQRSNATSLLFFRHDVSCFDAGVYVCEGSNENGRTSRKKVTMLVRCSPRPVRQIQRNITSDLNVPLTLSFKVIAYPEPGPAGFLWHKEDGTRWVPLLSNADLKIISFGLQSNLTLLNVSREDYGHYKVTVTNEKGVYEQHLFVSEKVSVQQHTAENICGMERDSTALIVGITLGTICVVQAVFAAYLMIIKRKMADKETKPIDKAAKPGTYANLTFSMDVVENQEQGGITTSGEEALGQQYTDLSHYADSDKNTYEQLMKP